MKRSLIKYNDGDKMVKIELVLKKFATGAVAKRDGYLLPNYLGDTGMTKHADEHLFITLGPKARQQLGLSEPGFPAGPGAHWMMEFENEIADVMDNPVFKKDKRVIVFKGGDGIIGMSGKCRKAVGATRLLGKKLTFKTEKNKLSLLGLVE